MSRPSGRPHPAAHSLMPLVTDPARLRKCARALMRRPGGPGADGITWASYRNGLDDRIGELAARLREGTWQPSPVQAVTLPSWGKDLILAVPTVEDRIVHRAMRTAAEPVLDADAYPPWLFGWRPRAGRSDAITAAAAHLAAGRYWVADLDVAAATSGADLGGTIGGVARWISDGTFLNLLRRVLAALPAPLAPGSGLSPMLTNLRLVPADEQLAGLAVIRVTDNYTVFCRTRAEAEHAAERVTAAIATCGLTPQPAKSQVWRPNPEDLYLAG
jgi:RNA-directed DNA polymerase